MKILRASLALVVLTLGARLAHAAGPAAGASPRDIPIEAFIDEPDFQSPIVSPDGKYLAFAAALGTGRRGVALLHLESGKIEPLVGPKDTDVTRLFWEGSDTVVFSGWLPRVDWIGLRSISISKREVVALSSTATYRDSLGMKENFVFLVDTLPMIHGKFLVNGFESKGSSEFVHSLMDARTGELTTVDHKEGTSLTLDVVPDSDGAIRARKRSERGRFVYEVKPKSGGGYRKVAEIPWTEPGWTLDSIGGDGDTLYVIVARDGPGVALHALDMRTGDLGQALLEVPAAEIEDVILSDDRKTLLGVIISGEKLSYHWFDQRRAKLQAQIDASLSGTFNEVLSSSADERFFLIEASSDREAGAYYLLDRKTPRISLVGRARAALDPKLMCPTEPVSFKARDGLEIHGYLTRRTRMDGGPAPLIVHPHHGPFDTRDSWGFDAWVQFLASRGYSVLQVNFRGSTGYGTAFERAGWGEIGGKIQDDISDAVQWAVGEGIADPGRVAIFGYGFGALAALQGIGKTPELFRCAVSYFPGVDTDNEVGAYSWRGPLSREYNESRMISKPEVRSERDLHNLVERFGAPSLHIDFYADKDVHDKWWLALRSRMVKHNKPFEEMIVKDRKLHENYSKHRLEAFKRIEAFLLKHMPPDE